MSRRKNGSVLVHVDRDRWCAEVELMIRVVCRQTLYRGETHRQDRVYLRVPLHRVRYLRQKVRTTLQVLCILL